MRSSSTPGSARVSRRRSRRRSSVAVTLLGVPALLAFGAVLALDAPPPPAAAAAPSAVRQEFVSAEAPSYLSTVGLFTAASEVVTGEIGRAESALELSRAILTGSAGRVLTEGARAELAEAIRLTEVAVTSARGVIGDANLAVFSSKTGGSFFAASADFVQATAALQADGGRDARDRADSLGSAAQAVTDAVAAWQLEQDARAVQEAERVVAAEAARVAAEQATAPAALPALPDDDNAGPAASGAAAFDKYVWTSGFQSEIDACNGAVDVTENYGVAVIAEHWSCGGAWFPQDGSVITLSGVRSGTFLVGGVAAVLDVDTDGIDDVPRGYDLLYQTCIGGSSATMSFTVLTRIG
jgi:hypothetical protein